jgi:hypothetical protein
VPDPHNRRSALALSDAGGHSRVAWVGLASAIVGQLIITAAEVIWQSNRDLGNVLFSVSPILTGAGLVTAGVAIIRAGIWARPSRFLPLTLGLYTILVLIPVMIASARPASAAGALDYRGLGHAVVRAQRQLPALHPSAVPSDPAMAEITGPT